MALLPLRCCDVSLLSSEYFDQTVAAFCGGWRWRVKMMLKGPQWAVMEARLWRLRSWSTTPDPNNTVIESMHRPCRIQMNNRLLVPIIYTGWCIKASCRVFNFQNSFTGTLSSTFAIMRLFRMLSQFRILMFHKVDLCQICVLFFLFYFFIYFSALCYKCKLQFVHLVSIVSQSCHR